MTEIKTKKYFLMIDEDKNLSLQPSHRIFSQDFSKNLLYHSCKTPSAHAQSMVLKFQVVDTILKLPQFLIFKMISGVKCQVKLVMMMLYADVKMIHLE